MLHITYTYIICIYHIYSIYDVVYEGKKVFEKCGTLDSKWKKIFSSCKFGLQFSFVLVYNCPLQKT